MRMLLARYNEDEYDHDHDADDAHNSDDDIDNMTNHGHQYNKKNQKFAALTTARMRSQRKSSEQNGKKTLKCWAHFNTCRMTPMYCPKNGPLMTGRLRQRRPTSNAFCAESEQGVRNSRQRQTIVAMLPAARPGCAFPCRF